LEKIEIVATEYTPYINLDPESRLVEIKGESFPENTFEFYTPILKWLKELLNSSGKVTINMEIVYFNSSSSQVFFNLFDQINDSVEENGLEAEINWIYEEDNESVLEAGEDFIEEYETLNFNLIIK